MHSENICLPICDHYFLWNNCH